MLVPNVGSPGWKKEHQITSSPSGDSDVTKVAKVAIENPILGKADLRHVKTSPKDKISKQVTKVAFRQFQNVNKASC
jgi:hypothetical protein